MFFMCSVFAKQKLVSTERPLIPFRIPVSRPRSMVHYDLADLARSWEGLCYLRGVRTFLSMLKPGHER